LAGAILSANAYSAPQITGRSVLMFEGFEMRKAEGVMASSQMVIFKRTPWRRAATATPVADDSLMGVRSMRRELICVEPASPPRLQVRTCDIPVPGRGQVLVRVEATAVNPIDARRAGGYGRRLLSLKGAATFPLVLGNDLAGTVEAVGPGVAKFAPGQRVYGLVATGKAGGAHASLIVVPEAQLLSAPDNVAAPSLAVLPYSFTTMWLALRSTQLYASNAKGKRVLVHGAAGALGRLALQLLAGLGARVTAICDIGKADDCLALGAELAVERGPQAIASLPADFDAVLNFASWDDELALASRLGSDALGHATTVHPLLGNFDRLGWVRGALASRRDARAVRSAVLERAPRARYAWTVFKPDPEALAALDAGVRERRLSLPVGLRLALEQADAAFAHVAAGKAGRAVLMP
jgi:NADPH:quinone reductase-like Zn-dependent oxidoreductase